MKRALPVIPLVLFFLFVNACGIPPDQLPNIINQTLIATSWTPTMSPTAYYISPEIVKLLNSTLPEDGMLQKVNELEATIGAKYQVVDVKYRVEKNGNAVLEVIVHCHCAANVECCSPERMFAKIMRSMEVYRDSVMFYIAMPINEMNVYCLDHGEQLAIMVVSWSDIREYLYGSMTGYQFGSRIRRK